MNGNGFVKFLLRSPMHGMISGNTMLITVKGRKTGKPVTTPVNYVRAGDCLWVISRRERTWWRNLIGGAPVKLVLRGREVDGFARAILDEQDVRCHLASYLSKMPLASRSLGVRIHDGKANEQDLTRTALTWLVVQVQGSS